MHIDIIHDTACPWCRIGKANLHKALESWTGEPVTLKYWAFQLNPNLPPEGSTFAEVMATKYRGVRLEQMFDGPRRAGQAAGLVFNFEAITRAPNTVLSHRLIAIAPEDQREAVMDQIYDAYFQHGRDIAQLDVLLDCAEAAGLDRAWAAGELAAGAGLEQVLDEMQTVTQAGLSGVPFFIIDGKLSLSGAQPPQVFQQAMAKALELRESSQD